MHSAVLALLTLLAVDPVVYMGHPVTVVDPGTDADGLSPKGEAKVCVQGQPDKDCFTAPKGFGRTPQISIVELRKGEQALLFEADSGGVSGWSLYFALLEFCDQKMFPGCKADELENRLAPELTLSNQSQHAFWDLPEISDSKVFVTATDVWGPREAHYSPHRYIVSVYVRRPDDFDENTYYLTDQFMTVRSYDVEANDVLAAEKQEILGRLRRVKASWSRQPAQIKPLR